MKNMVWDQRVAGSNPATPTIPRTGTCTETPVLCGAVETILAAAIKLGEVICTISPPARHHTVLYALPESVDHLLGPEDQGFITTSGRFVGRREALKIALATGQIERQKQGLDELFSEDMW